MIHLTVPSRLHLGLLDLGRVTRRTFGGFGIGICEPHLEIFASPCDHIELAGAVTDHESYRLTACMRDLLSQIGASGASVRVERLTHRHVGLGHGTALTLGTLLATSRVNNVSLDSATLQRLSRRGGTSGVGIQTFFDGGFVVDAGQPQGAPFQPSAFQIPRCVPPVISRFPLNEAWRVNMFLPEGFELAGNDEVDFFERSTPIHRAEVLEQMALLYHGIVPAMLEGDLGVAGDCYAAFSDLGFKAKEIANRGGLVRDALAYLRTKAPFVGMSSVGPLVFTISERSLTNELHDLPENLLHVAETNISNRGFSVNNG